jgi:hypothetical protein
LGTQKTLAEWRRTTIIKEEQLQAEIVKIDVLSRGLAFPP